jgi:hypothetical protein
VIQKKKKNTELASILYPVQFSKKTPLLFRFLKNPLTQPRFLKRRGLKILPSAGKGRGVLN